MNGQPGGVPIGDTTIEDWLQLIRAEYLESPGLRLTKRYVLKVNNDLVKHAVCIVGG